MDKRSIYLIGSFGTGFRDRVIESLGERFIIDDPREHDQSSIARLDYCDMTSAENCDIALVYISKGKRAGTMSYCELGAARAKGKCIIAVDENSEKDKLIKKIASHYRSSLEDASDLLNQMKYQAKFGELPVDDKTKSREPYKSILFAGNPVPFFSFKQLRKTKKIYLDKSPTRLENFVRDVDLIVVNFEKGEPHDTKGLFFMGLGYATKIPVIELEGNPVPYPPLIGLARRTFVGERRFDHLAEYLKHLESQHIRDEAQVYYKLMEKFNH